MRSERVSPKSIEAALGAGALDVFAAARDSPGRVALVEAGVATSYAELASEVAEERARWHVLAPEPTLAFVAEPTRSTVLRLLGALGHGRPALPLHPRLPPERRAALVERATSALTPAAPGLDGEAIALLLATSGTTGTPRLARLSRRALVASALASEANLAWEEDDRWLVAMPLAHAGGVSILVRCLAARRAVVLHPGFDPERVLASIDAEGVTLLSVVPTMLAALLDRDRGELARLRAVLVGGAACPRDLLAEARRRGVPALATYGLTETGSQLATQPLHEAQNRGAVAGDSGLVLPGFELRIVRGAASGDGASASGGLAPAEGLLAAPGEAGRIEVRGPALFSGYVGEAPHAPEAWFATSDLGRVDARGRLEVLGRADDVIVTGGENVHPLAVEAALEGVEGVAAMLACGLPDPRWGEIVALGVVLRPDGNDELVRAAIAARAEARLARHERPRRVVVLEALPLGLTGKADRRALRARLARDAG